MRKNLIRGEEIKATKLGRAVLKSNLQELYRATDRMFVYLLAGQWVLAIALALFVSPYSWSGRERVLSFHVETAIVLGGILTLFPCWLLKYRSGTAIARYVVAVTQACWSLLLIHLTGGRIETHFHIFGSLAFIAFYRDWKLLIPTTAVVTLGHVVGIFAYPQSIYGVANPEWWRFLEHAAWVIFEDIFLVIACLRSYREIEVGAERQAELESIQDKIQEEVELKTEALMEAGSQKEQLQMELLQAHKLESVGRLASGIAHEINTPIQYVTDSVYFAKDGMQDFFDLIEKLELAATNFSDEHRAILSELLSDPQIEYLRDNLPQALERSTDGLNRVAEIVRSMKAFAYPDRVEMTPSDLNEAIKTTLVVCRNEYKYLAEIELDLGNIPLVMCHIGEINQVLTNLIINASHAISARLIDPAETGTIKVQSRQEGDHVVISVTDTGCGIPEDIRNRIFEPFFTTKGVGRGTGQGLAVVHGVIVTKLGGSISVDSQLNEGTTFSLSIPIQQNQEEEAA